jgi:hypothetical protein
VKLEFQPAAMKQAWRFMLAVDLVIAAAAFAWTLIYSVPDLQYVQLLSTYHFGFARRALVGTIVSWFTDVVPIWYVYAIGITAWIATLSLFVATFRKVFGLNEKNFALFVFLVGSPFFFKNFMISLGYFDIYGCLWALVALLIPVGALYPLIIAVGCIFLILMHHLHFLLYIPAIAFVVLARYILVGVFSVGKLLYGVCLVLVLSVAFAMVALFGRISVPEPTFLAYLISRASDTVNPERTSVWYSTFGMEMRNTWNVMRPNSARLPAYVALICLHLPIASYFKSMIGGLAAPFHRTISIAGLVAITVGYLAIFAVASDYSRWISNWAVCMFLVMHAVRLLPSTRPDSEAPVRPDKAANVALGWIVTAIPRVGITTPF